MSSNRKSNPRKVKKISLRLPKIRGFAIDSISILPDFEETKPDSPKIRSPEADATPLKFSNACTSISPNLLKDQSQGSPSSKIIWNFISNLHRKDSSPKSEPFSFCVKGSNFSVRNLSKDLKNLRETKKFSRKDLSMQNCSSCNVTKSLVRNLSCKSADSKSEAEGSRQIKRRIWKIRGSLVK